MRKVLPYTTTVIQMGSDYEVMLDDKIELHTELHDAGSTRPYQVRLVQLIESSSTAAGVLPVLPDKLGPSGVPKNRPCG